KRAPTAIVAGADGPYAGSSAMARFSGVAFLEDGFAADGLGAGGSDGGAFAKGAAQALRIASAPKSHLIARVPPPDRRHRSTAKRRYEDARCTTARRAAWPQSSWWCRTCGSRRERPRESTPS